MNRPWLDPCGRKADWVRSCYRVPMVFAAEGDPAPVAVRWYFADDSQAWLPDGNQFCSDNWVSRESVAGEIGEQPGARPWVNGADPRRYPVQTGDPCLLDPKFVAGLDEGELTGPWDSGGKLGCCTCACDGYPCDLAATITSLSGCSGFEGTFSLALSSSSPCIWTGTIAFWGGTAIFTLAESSGVFAMAVDCVTPLSTFTLVTQQDSPLLLVFDADDASLCCDFAGFGTWRITIQGQ